MAKTASSPVAPRSAAGTRLLRFALNRSAHDPPLAGGEKLGRYEVIKLVGEGGMGRVYEARHQLLGRRVALKLLRGDLRYRPQHVLRFAREAVAASRIGHENIVDVQDCVELPGGEIYTVMEFLDGQGLDAWMGQPGLLSPALRWLAQVCDGLEAAHGAGVIHRDIKPANLFLARNRGTDHIVPKLLDFGIAKVLDLDGESLQTEAGTVLGTPHYMAPERALQRDAGPSADIYSMAVILYELLTGEVPFDGERHMEVIAHQLHTQAVDPRQRAPDSEIPDALARLTMRGLEKLPSRRVPTAAAFGSGLRRILDDHSDGLARVSTGPRFPRARHDAETRAVGTGCGSRPCDATTVPPRQAPTAADSFRRGAPARGSKCWREGSSSAVSMETSPQYGSRGVLWSAVLAVGFAVAVAGWCGTRASSPRAAPTAGTDLHGAKPSMETRRADDASVAPAPLPAATPSSPQLRNDPAAQPRPAAPEDPGTSAYRALTTDGKKARCRPRKRKSSLANERPPPDRLPPTNASVEAGPTIKSDVYDD
ncbi:MAG: serine/threonine-protein kinase [Nannocystaceae bacterium]